MNPHRLTIILGTAALGCALATGLSGCRGSHASSAPGMAQAPLSTPEGITLQALGRGQGWDLGKETASVIFRDEVAFADARGRTLYTYDKDEPGKSNCVAECAERFNPVIALEGARVFGEWSLVKREDGAQQWAWRSQPLYTYREDADPGSVFGNSAARFGAKRKDGFGNVVGGGRRGSGARGAADKPPVPDWTPALFHSRQARYEVPAGLGVAEVLDATGLVLTDHRQRTVYVFDGSPADERKAVLSGQWHPVVAPAVAVARGDYSIRARDDGRTQWVWKDQPLYTFAEDRKAGDAYGVGNGWQPAALYRHFTPEGVTEQLTDSQGLVWANAQGMTLYKRDGHIYQSGGGRSLHRGAPQRPAVGRDIGVNAHCDAQCQQQWQPFLAPADAKPQGYWDVYTRPDGSKQWAYQGFALWTYAGDKQPGDMYGHETYDMYFAMDPKVVVDVGTPMDGIATLIWSVAFP